MRSSDITRRRTATEEVVKKHLPTGFTVKVEPIALAKFVFGLSHGDFQLQPYYTNFGHFAQRTHDHVVGSDLDILSDSGKIALRVRVWEGSRPIIWHDSEAELQLAQSLAQVLRKEGFFVRRIPVLKGINQDTGNMGRD